MQSFGPHIEFIHSHRVLLKPCAVSVRSFFSIEIKEPLEILNQYHRFFENSYAFHFHA